MVAVDYVEFQQRTQPLAFLITFRCYGTWFHGDARGSVDRRKYHRYGTADMTANSKLVEDEKSARNHPTFNLDSDQRAIVEESIRQVCSHRGYGLLAVNARTNHVHAVVAASCKPEHAMNAFKAYATRNLRKSGLLGKDVRVWARHGSTRYLWTEGQIDDATAYVVYGQGNDILGEM